MNVAGSNAGTIDGAGGDGWIQILALSSAPVASIPTLSQWGQGVLAGLLALGGLAALRRQRKGHGAKR